MGSIRDINTLKTIRDRMIADLLEINSSIDTQQGTITKDIIDSASTEIRNQNVVLDYVVSTRNLDSFVDIANNNEYLEELREALGADSTDDILNLLSSDLDGIALTFGVSRTAAKKASYIQRFYRADDNGGSAITIPLSTQVSTFGGDDTFATITSLAQVPRLDSETGLYYVEETAQAIAGGTAFNVALGVVTSMTPQLAIAPQTTNVAIIRSGVDEETDTALVERLKNVRQGRNFPTIDGLRNFAKGTIEGSPLSFTDASVVSPGDDLMTRSFSGGVDVYVVDKNLITTKDILYFIPGVDSYRLSMQPVASVASVDAQSAGSKTFTFTEDTESAWAGSTMATGTVVITDTAGIVLQEGVEVVYTYDGAIRDAQEYVSQSQTEWHVPDMDLLFRQGILIVISIDAEVVTFGDRTLGDVQADIENDLAAFFSGGTTSIGVTYSPKELGEDIDQSDIISIITTVEDVDRVTISGPNAIVFYKDAVVTADDPVAVEVNEYARLGTVTFL